MSVQSRLRRLSDAFDGSTVSLEHEMVPDKTPGSEISAWKVYVAIDSDARELGSSQSARGALTKAEKTARTLLGPRRLPPAN